MITDASLEPMVHRMRLIFQQPYYQGWISVGDSMLAVKQELDLSIGDTKYLLNHMIALGLLEGPEEGKVRNRCGHRQIGGLVWRELDP